MNFQVGDAISPSTMMAARGKGGGVGGLWRRADGGRRTGEIVEKVTRPRLLILAVVEWNSVSG